MPLPPERIAALVDEHAVPLRIWVGRRWEEPEDIVQEAFCRLAAMHPPPQRPAPWLYRVARNLAANEGVFRRRRKARERRVAASEQYVHDPAEAVLASDAVRAVMWLESGLREVVVARIWGQLTFDEIGRLCGVSTATASRRYRSALEELRKQLRVSCPTSNP